jgi:hypothetical protein
MPEMPLPDEDEYMISHEPITFEPSSLIDKNYLLLIEQMVRIDSLLQQRLEHLQEENDALQERPDIEQWQDAPPEWLSARQQWPAPEELDEAASSGRLGQLVRRFSLSPMARDILLLALMPYLDPRYYKVFAQAQNQSRMHYPSPQFALDILCPEPRMQAQHQMHLLPSAPLIRYRLLRLDGTPGDYHGSMIKPDPAIFHFLIGHDYLPAILDSYARYLPAQAATLNLDSDIQKQLTSALCPPSVERIVLKGSPGNRRSSLVAQAAWQQGMPSLLIDLSMLSDDPKEALPVLQAAARETHLKGACLIVKNLPEWSKKNPVLFSRWQHDLRHFPQPLVSLQDRHATVCWISDKAHLVIEMPLRSLHQDQSLLAQQLQENAIPVSDEMHLDTLAQRFPIIASRLPPTLQEAELYRRQRDPASPLQHADLHQAFRWRSQQNFGELAHRMEPRRSIDDWIVSADLQQQMQELLAAVRQHGKTGHAGFDTRARGISALFHGTSGTGKTMGAEVLASALGVDLITIDLSTVVNKYIGETEKNLSTIFDLAAQDSGVLFFDEADALFGKRGESKDSKDRHANIEVAYLLQRMEAHAGLIILSTNNRSHLDNAFSRRFTFTLKFSFPDHATRVRLWRGIWPETARLDEGIDFERLASQAELTGANIGNIARAACWLAADENTSSIGMQHIQQALKRELAKTGQVAFN